MIVIIKKREKVGQNNNHNDKNSKNRNMLVLNSNYMK